MTQLEHHHQEPYTIATESLDFMDSMADYRTAVERRQRGEIDDSTIFGRIAAILTSLTK